MASSDLGGVDLLIAEETAYEMARSKLAEVLEKVLKAELLRIGWFLQRTHDLDLLLDALVERKSDLIAGVEPLCDGLSEAYFTARYPGFDAEDPDWPELKELAGRVRTLLTEVRSRM